MAVLTVGAAVCGVGVWRRIHHRNGEPQGYLAQGMSVSEKVKHSRESNREKRQGTDRVSWTSRQRGCVCTSGCVPGCTLPCGAS